MNVCLEDVNSEMVHEVKLVFTGLKDAIKTANTTAPPNCAHNKIDLRSDKDVTPGLGRTSLDGTLIAGPHYKHV